MIWKWNEQQTDIPWCFLSLMIFVVAGPTTAKLAKLLANMVTKGKRTFMRFLSWKTPARPESWDPSGERSPGYVRASIMGSAVCMLK